MTYLRQCYTCESRFYKDSTDTATKVWYWAEEGASVFQHYSLFGSQHFMDRNQPTSEWKYPGELPGFNITSGSNPLSVPGKKGCQIGKTQWFAEGVPIGTTIDDVVIPLCCVPPRRPDLDLALVEQGNPDVVVFSAPVNNHSFCLFFSLFDGPLTTPPSPPSGWSIITNEQWETHNLWRMIGFRGVVLPAPFPIVQPGGTCVLGSTNFTFWEHLEDAIVDMADDAVFGQWTINAPSVEALRSASVLVICVWSTRHITSQPPPPDMFSAGGLDEITGSYVVYYQYPIGPGPTLHRTIDLGGPADAIAVSFLLR